MHTCTHTNMHTHKQAVAHTNMHTCTRAHTCTHTNMHLYMLACTCTHKHAHTQTCSRTHKHAHTCTRAHTQTHIQTRARAHARGELPRLTRASARSRRRAPWPGFAKPTGARGFASNPASEESRRRPLLTESAAYLKSRRRSVTCLYPASFR